MATRLPDSCAPFMQSTTKSIFIALAVAVLLAVIILRKTNMGSTGNWAIAAVAATAAVIFIFLRISTTWRRRRTVQFHQELEEEGFRPIADNIPAVTLHPLPKHAHHLNESNATFRYGALNTLEGFQPALYVQHRYAVNLGNVAYSVTHRVAVLPVPSAWPTLRIHKSKASGKRFGVWKKLPSIELDTEAFGQAFRVQSTNSNFAIMLCDPTMQAWMLDHLAEVNCGLHIENGQLWYLEKGAVTAESLRIMRDRLESLVHLIHPDLWVSAHPPSDAFHTEIDL